MSKVVVERVQPDELESSPLIRRINQLFRTVEERAFDLFSKAGGENGHSLEHWLSAERELFSCAKAELIAKDDGVELKVALPGFETSEIEVTALPHEIVIRASHKGEKSGTRGHVEWSELEEKDVCRRIALPCAIDVDSARSELNLGILTVNAAKRKAETTAAAAA